MCFAPSTLGAGSQRSNNQITSRIQILKSRLLNPIVFIYWVSFRYFFSDGAALVLTFVGFIFYQLYSPEGKDARKEGEHRPSVYEDTKPLLVNA